MPEKCLLIGKDARTHAIGKTLKKNTDIKIYSYAEIISPGLKRISEKTRESRLDKPKLIEKFVKECGRLDFAVIGPDEGIQLGIPDLMEKLEVPAVGPIKKLGILETSKIFTRNFLDRHCPEVNPDFKIFTKAEGIVDFLNEINDYVIKPDGLTAGKGVKVFGDHIFNTKDALEYCKKLLEKDKVVLIEEKLIGEEFSLQSFVDGRTVVDTVVVQDNKRAYDDDKGPNTGGMGSYSCENHLLPFLKKEDINFAHDINQKVCNALKRKDEVGEEYKGIMYGSFIKTASGVKVIEYNARFADPEALNVLPILKSNLTDIFHRIIEGNLSTKHVEFERKATVCKYVVPEGYPEVKKERQKVELPDTDPEGVERYYAAVKQENDDYYFLKSRGIAFVGIGDDLYEAEAKAERAAESIKGPVFHRKDIGTRNYIRRKIDRMEKILSTNSSSSCSPNNNSRSSYYAKSIPIKCLHPVENTKLEKTVQRFS